MKLHSKNLLISTYWNVNQQFQQLKILNTDTFNLNLLECKLKIKRVTIDASQPFNLNLLECK